MLSDREAQVVRLLLSGLRVPLIARQLYLSPSTVRNHRARDIIDLLLLRDLVNAEQSPTADELRQACLSLFQARAAEARKLGRPERKWPPIAIAHEHWSRDYSVAATAGGVTVPLADAISELNTWIALIDAAG